MGKKEAMSGILKLGRGSLSSKSESQEAISELMKLGRGLVYRSLSSKSESLNLVESKNVPSTQAEALTGAITGGLEKVKADIAKSEVNHERFQAQFRSLNKLQLFHLEEEHQSNRVVEEVQKLRAEIEKMQDNIATMRAEQRHDQTIRIHQLEKDVIKIPSDLRTDFNQLKAELEITKYMTVKYAIVTLASVSAVGMGMLCLMW